MDAKAVQEIRRLQGVCHGGLTAKQLVEYARDKASPLHSHLTWDDSEAAEAFRLGQARNLIRKVSVQVMPAPQRETRISAVLSPAARTTQNVTTLRPKTHAERLSDALSELRELCGKYHDLAELASVRTAIERVATAAPVVGQVGSVPDAARFARALEQSGVDRQTAVERAQVRFKVQRMPLVEELRKRVA